MKTLFVLFAFFVAIPLRADGPLGAPVGNHLISGGQANVAAHKARMAAEIARKQNVAQAGPSFGTLIVGKVIQVVPAGLLVDVTPRSYNYSGEFKTVMLVNYPGQAGAVDGDTVSVNAALAGRYQYTAVSGGLRTIEKYDVKEYQRLLAEQARRDLEWTQHREKLAAEAIIREEERRMADAPRILAYQQQQASNGYPSFQFILGKRYLTGDGVETNLALARHWLSAASTNGESQAARLLQQVTELNRSQQR